MTPYSEPNSIPPLFSSPQDWRETYAAYVGYFNASNKTVSDEVHLAIRLKRLGFVGVNLEAELKHIKTCTPHR